MDSQGKREQNLTPSATEQWMLEETERVRGGELGL